MQKLISKRSWNKVGDVAHKLKPSITFMGIESLKPVVKKIEDYGRENYKTDEIPSLVNVLSGQCQSAFKELKQALNNL